MMWPLLACSVALVAVLIERAWQIGLRRKVFGCRLSPGALTWHRRVLPFFRDVPPSIGLLGTVVGVVQSFQLVHGRLDGDAVGAGLGVACLTTVLGLGIGITASVSEYLLDWATGSPAREAVG
jgi:biopolymer transport protein ExbB/TolQ